MPKKYSIVRVDGECPKGFNEDIYCKWCGNCGRLYGDTKEQMVKKVAQALERTIIDGIYVRFGKPITVEKLATDVVEFLGVK